MRQRLPDANPRPAGAGAAPAATWIRRLPKARAFFGRGAKLEKGARRISLLPGIIRRTQGTMPDAARLRSWAWTPTRNPDRGALAELSLMDIHRISPPPLLTLTGHVGKVTCVAGSPDQHTIYSGGSDGTIRLWSCPFGRQKATWNAHPGG